MNHIFKNRKCYALLLTGDDIAEYVAGMRNVLEYGNAIELQAISEFLNTAVHLYAFDEQPFAVFNESEVGEPMKLAFRNGCHYEPIAR